MNLFIHDSNEMKIGMPESEDPKGRKETGRMPR